MIGRELFDWKGVPNVDPDELARWMNATDAVSRLFPLQLALQVHDELEREMMEPRALDAERLREIRGGLMALARFARIYDAAALSVGRQPKRKGGGRDA